MAKSTPGIHVRHQRGCPATHDRDARCRCSPSYQAHVWSARERKRIRKTFRSFDEAKAWRAETLVGLRRGTMRAPSACSESSASRATGSLGASVTKSRFSIARRKNCDSGDGGVERSTVTSVSVAS